MQKTYVAKRKQKGEVWKQEWYIVDAKGKVLGRLASQIAKILQGKHKPIYTPHVDVGDYVIVINASKVKLTGKKRDQKKYIRHSGYPGGLMEKSYRKLFEEKPSLPLEEAVRRMLPKSTLGRRMFKKLKVYPNENHPHQAQNPKPLDP
jgi:large subunit ribosomal protein L13